MIRFASFFFTLVLGACASQPAAIHYYLLNSTTADATSTWRPQAQVVRLQQLVLAEYLTQSNLPIRIGENQIYYSPQDVWAQPLEESMTDALLADLNHFAREHNVVSAAAPDAAVATAELRIRVDHFHPTDSGIVEINGTFWLVNNTPTLRVERTPFSFSVEMEKDGYAHSVSKQRELLETLAKTIADHLQAKQS